MQSRLAGARAGLFWNLLVLVGVAVAMLAWLLRPDSLDEARLNAPAQATRPDDALADVTAPAFGEPAPARRGVAEASEAPIAGLVLDELFQTPVLAVVRPDVGPAVGSDPYDGRFELHAESLGATRLRAEAQGFEPATVDLADHDPAQELEIRLCPSALASVVVEYSGGSPVAGAAVRWSVATRAPEEGSMLSWMELPPAAEPKDHETRTDSRGRSSAPLPGRGVVIVEDPRSRATRSAWIAPGQEQRIVLPDEPIELRFVDHESREPLPGFQAEAWCPREADAGSVRLVADEQGVAHLLATSFPVFVRRPGTQVYFGPLLPLSSGTSRAGFGVTSELQPMVRIDAGFESPVLVGVRTSDDVRVRLVDASTGSPLSTDARVQVRHIREYGDPAERTFRGFVHSPRFDAEVIGHVQRTADGTVVIPRTLWPVLNRGIDPLELVWGRYPDARLVVTASGYRPLDCHPGVASLDPETGLPRLELEPAQSRRLRARYADGTPYRGPISLSSLEERVGLYASRGIGNGLHGPFDWYGGPVHVKARSGDPAEPLLSAEALAVNEVVDLTFPGDWGSIELVGVPASAAVIPIVARSGSGQHSATYRADVVDGDRRRFTGLPPGTYMVGPLPWLRLVEGSTLSFFDPDGADSPARSLVRAGEVTRVEWDVSWISGRSFEGRVRLVGAGGHHPLVYPLYRLPGGTEVKPRLSSFGRPSRRITLDADGHYHIGPDDPAPELLAVCAANGHSWGGFGGLRLLEVLRPGESVDVPVGAVELVWSGELPGWMGPVQYSLSTGDLRVPLRHRYLDYRCPWSGEEPLRIDDVPLAVDEILVHGHRFPIEVRAGELTRVVVDLSTAPRADLPEPEQSSSAR